MLDDNGLVACGTHTPYESILEHGSGTDTLDAVKRSFEALRKLGKA